MAYFDGAIVQVVSFVVAAAATVNSESLAFQVTKMIPTMTDVVMTVIRQACHLCHLNLSEYRGDVDRGMMGSTCSKSLFICCLETF